MIKSAKYTPCAKRETHNVGGGFGRVTAWVAYARRPDKTLYLVSGRPIDTQAEALAEAMAYIQTLGAA